MEPALGSGTVRELTLTRGHVNVTVPGKSLRDTRDTTGRGSGLATGILHASRGI